MRYLVLIFEQLSVFWFGVHRQFYRVVLFYCYYNWAMKQSLVHLSNFVMWVFANSFSISFSTLSCIWVRILLPFSWIEHRGYLNFELTMWFFEIPCLSNKFLILLKNLFFQPSDCSHMSTSNLNSSLGAGFCVVTIPTCPCKSNPIIQLVLHTVTRNVAPFTSQPADRRFVFNVPNTQIGCLL